MTDSRSQPEGSAKWLRPSSWIKLGRDQPAPETTPQTRTDGSGLVDCAVYHDGKRLAGAPTPSAALAQARSVDGAFVWIGLHEPSLEEFAHLAQTFGLHELAVEDAVKAYQRPKLERYGDSVLFALRTVRYVEHAELTEHSEVIETGQVILFVGPNFVITVRHGDACRLSDVRAELESKPTLLAEGPWAVVYGICDRVVDLYLDVTASMEQDIDALEESVFARQSKGGIAQIYQLKRELVEFRRAATPLARPLGYMVDPPTPLSEHYPISTELHRYFRDVADHLARVLEQLNAYDDLVNSILQARFTQVSVDQNNDMRKIAAWAAIAAAQTTIAGIYGMNFDHMPELHWQYGYGFVIGFMVLTSVGLYRLFRRSGWL